MVSQIKVSKFDAIKEQLDTAIKLYFTSDDYISTHTLVAAAYNSLKDIATKEGAERPFLKSEYIESLPDEKKQLNVEISKCP